MMKELMPIFLQIPLLLLLLAKDKNDGEKELFKRQRYKAPDIVMVIIMMNILGFINIKLNTLPGGIDADVMYVILIVFILLVFKFRIKQNVATLGFDLDKLKPNTAIILTTALINYVFTSWLYFVERDSIEYALNTRLEISQLDSFISLVKYVGSTVILAPVVEEAICRGILYSVYRKKFGIIKAIIITSLFFSLNHFGGGLVPFFIGGLLLGYLYERTESLLATITAHGAYNLLSLITVYYYYSGN